MKINLIPDNSVSSAPAGFTEMIETAASVYEQDFPGNYTVNITYGWGTIDNQADSLLTNPNSGAFSQGGVENANFVSYATIKNWLGADAAVRSLPASYTALPDDANSFFVSSSQEKALGQYTGSSTAIDGSIGFNTADASSSTPAYWEEAALQEIGHALGWLTGYTAPQDPTILDLFRYASAGQYQWAGGQPAYFSLDGGNTDVANFLTSGDYTLFANYGTNDPFALPFTGDSSRATLTSLDTEIFNILGFGDTAPSATAPSASIVGAGGLTNQPDQTIEGAGEAGTQVLVFDNGLATPVGGPVTVDSNGDWAATVTLSSEGANTLVATDTDAAGNVASSNSVTYNLDTVPPTVAFDTGVTFSSRRNATFTGSVSDAAGVASVEVFDGSEALGAATLNGDGTWTFAATLPRGVHDMMSVTATDWLGNTSSTPAPFELQTGIRGEPYTTFEGDVNSAGQATGDIFTQADGVVEWQDNVEYRPSGAYITNVTNGSFFESLDYYSFSFVDSASNVLLQQTFFNNDGTNTTIGYKNNLILNALGNATMTGGGNHETFVFKAHPGEDTITDFRATGPRHDTISLSGGEFSSIAQILNGFTQQNGSDTVITLGPHSSITLDNMAADTLSRGDFILRA
jgi:Bacterial Ig-like domain